MVETLGGIPDPLVQFHPAPQGATAAAPRSGFPAWRPAVHVGPNQVSMSGGGESSHECQFHTWNLRVLGTTIPRSELLENYLKTIQVCKRDAPLEPARAGILRLSTPAARIPNGTSQTGSEGGGGGGGFRAR